MKLRVMVILGTRPEIIKLAPVIQELEDREHEVIMRDLSKYNDIIIAARDADVKYRKLISE